MGSQAEYVRSRRLRKYRLILGIPLLLPMGFTLFVPILNAGRMYTSRRFGLTQFSYLELRSRGGRIFDVEFNAVSATVHLLALLLVIGVVHYGARWLVKLRTPRSRYACVRCGYDRRGKLVGPCPECGSTGV